MTLPPPTPSRPLKAPPTVPTAASFQVRDMAGDTTAMGPVEADDGALERLLDPFRKDPGRSAILTDVDGGGAPAPHEPPPPAGAPGGGGGAAPPDPRGPPRGRGRGDDPRAASETRRALRAGRLPER